MRIEFPSVRHHRSFRKNAVKKSPPNAGMSSDFTLRILKLAAREEMPSSIASSKVARYAHLSNLAGFIQILRTRLRLKLTPAILLAIKSAA
jgi:hypothetical protein